MYSVEPGHARRTSLAIRVPWLPGEECHGLPVGSDSKERP